MSKTSNDTRFDTFQSGPENQAALDLCRAIAGLQFADPKPVLLLGPSGAGKSHLLWAIINHIRTEKIKTGLALIVPDDFPQALRDLLIDPTPIQSPLPAILLVDALDAFFEYTADLEKVITLFLENGHPVVLTSRLPHDRLDHFSAPFRGLLKQANLAVMDMPIPDSDPEETVDTHSAQETDQDSLAWKLAETQALLEDAREEQARLRHALEDTRERDLLRARHAESIQAFENELDALRQELGDIRRERDELATQASENSGQSARIDELNREIAVLREENRNAHAETERLQTDLERTYREYDRLRGLMVAMEGLEQELREIRDERDAARDAYLRLVEELSSMIDEILPEDEDIPVEEAPLQFALAPLREYIANALYPGSQGAIARHERLRLASALEAAQRHLALQSAEMDALRHEAAQQVASAQVASGEMERRIAQLELALEAALETGRATAAEAKRIGDDLYHATEAVNLLLSGLGRLDVLHPPPQSTQDNDDTDQETLFDTEPYRRTPLFDPDRFRDVLDATCPDTSQQDSDSTRNADLQNETPLEQS